MSLKEFIRKNREEIDAFIRGQVEMKRITNEERRLWILNDEGLIPVRGGLGWRG